MQRILLIQTAFIGDVILATPVILELNRLFPNTELDVLVKKGNAVLLQNNPAINFVFEFDKSLGKTQEIVRLTKLFRQRRYDLTINLHRFGSSGLLTLLSGAKATYGFRKNPFSIFFSKRFDHRIGDGTHEVERNLSVIHELGAKLFVPPRLFIGFEEEAKTAVYKVQPYYCFAPASVWFTKQMPENKWVELIRNVSVLGKIFLLGAQSDFTMCQRIINESSVENSENLAGKLTLLETASLIRDAKRTFVNDSGPLHIASAMNAPVTAYFCSTSPAFGFGPLSEDRQIIESEVKLPCKPCGIHGYRTCPKGHFNCGIQINVFTSKR